MIPETKPEKQGATRLGLAEPCPPGWVPHRLWPRPGMDEATVLPALSWDNLVCV